MSLEVLPPADHLSERKLSLKKKNFILLVFVVVQTEKVKKQRMNKKKGGVGGREMFLPNEEKPS